MSKDIVSIEYLLDILISIQEWLKGNSNNFNNTQNTHDDGVNEQYSDLLSSSVTSSISFDKNNKKSDNHHQNLNQEKEKQIDSLTKFLDTSQNSIEMLQKAKEKRDEQIKYLELEKEMENTVRMTQEALKNNLPPSLGPLTNSITAAALNNRHKQINDHNLLNLIESQLADDSFKNLSSSSSISGIGVLSDIKRKKQVLLDSYSKLKQQQRKVVKFDDDFEESSNLSSNNSECSTIMSEVITSKNNNNKKIHDTTNELSIIRNAIKEKGDKDEKVIKLLLKSVYNEDLKDAESLMRQSVDKIKNRSELTNNLYVDAHRPASSASIRAPTKSVFVADDYKRPLRRAVSRTASISPSRSSRLSHGSQQRSHSQLRSSFAGRKNIKSKFIIGEDGILSKLLEEFPYLYLSPESIHDLWQKHSKQIEHLQREQRELETKYSKENENTTIRKHLTETYNKQNTLMDIMRKEIEHMQRIQDLKRKQNVENALKIKAREQRFENVKIKNYYEEFRLQQRAKMLKKLTKEEVLFKQLFNESLKIQKERIREMKKYAKEQRDIKTKQQLNQIESIENFYKNKFNLLNEKIKKEKLDNEIREKSQHEILTKMKSQLKKKLETDIRDLQSQLCNDEDYMYWRQLDANRVENDLKSARYKATV